MRTISWIWLTVVVALVKGHLNSITAITDNDNDKNRLSPILDYAEKLQETGAIQFPVQGINIFRELCDIYAHFKECTRDISCSSISVQAIDASYGYMCGEGYQFFETYATCFAEVEAESNYVKCRKKANEAITTAQKIKIPTNYSQYFELLCEIMDDYLRCCQPIINTFCGHNAWELVRTVTLDSLHVTMPTCDLHNALL
uniref:Bm7462, isoform b n=1 Tax=Brugia malayi TaxID=6279 RepID=A0A1I9G073_BRUMA|nr:Bm7462, isoform b [Brugia malayi]